MVAYSFKRRFVEPMLWGRKDGTIRALRSHGHAEPGQKIANYVGMRTKSCELILRSVCIMTLPIVLKWKPIVEVIVNDEKLPTKDFDFFAQRDGFADFSDMERFWFETHGDLIGFRGEMIRWRAPSSPVEMGADLTSVKNSPLPDFAHEKDRAMQGGSSQ